MMCAGKTSGNSEVQSTPNPTLVFVLSLFVSEDHVGGSNKIYIMDILDIMEFRHSVIFTSTPPKFSLRSWLHFKVNIQ